MMHHLLSLHDASKGSHLWETDLLELLAASREFIAEGSTLPIRARVEKALEPFEFVTFCSTCLQIEIEGGFGPSHEGSKHCESGSIASGGDRAHCTCDVCF